MKQYKAGVIGCTGMVGQRFITLLEHHPWFRQRPERRENLRGSRVPPLGHGLSHAG